MKTNHLLPALLAALWLAGCGSSPRVESSDVTESTVNIQTEAAESNPDPEADSDGPPNELPTERWPDEPVAGTWYRAVVGDIPFCPWDILLFAQAPEGFVYRDPQFMLRQELMEPVPDAQQTFYAYARLNEDNSIDFYHNSTDPIGHYVLEPFDQEVVCE